MSRYSVWVPVTLGVTYEVDSEHIDDVLADTKGRILRAAIQSRLDAMSGEELLALLDCVDADITEIGEYGDDPADGDAAEEESP